MGSSSKRSKGETTESSKSSGSGSSSSSSSKKNSSNSLPLFLKITTHQDKVILLETNVASLSPFLKMYVDAMTPTETQNVKLRTDHHLAIARTYLLFSDA